MSRSSNLSCSEAQRWFAILALLIMVQNGPSQTWLHWPSASGGNNHYYALTPTATNWSAAQKLAVSWGGTLATITSSNEQNFINATFLTGAFDHLPLWVGLRDPSPNGTLTQMWRRMAERVGIHHTAEFKWVTGEPFSYSNWKPGEPSNNPPGENYVAINWEYSDDPPRGLKGDWNDTPLNGTAGFGGKTDGPYFGLVERETDPSQPPRRGATNAPVSLAMITVLTMALVIVLMMCFARFRRHKKSVA